MTIEVGNIVMYKHQLYVVVSIYDPDYEHNVNYTLAPYKEVISVSKSDVQKVNVQFD